jgi:hypothetical protein
MTPTDTDHGMNGWVEPGRTIEGAARRDQRPNRWSDASVIGEEVEGWLAAITRPKRVELRDAGFLGSADAQLPGTRRNTWREPLDETSRDTLA